MQMIQPHLGPTEFKTWNSSCASNLTNLPGDADAHSSMGATGLEKSSKGFQKRSLKKEKEPALFSKLKKIMIIGEILKESKVEK